MFDCKIKELLNIQAWIIREDFLKEMTFTLKPVGKAGTIQVKSGQAVHQEEGKECVEVQRWDWEWFVELTARNFALLECSIMCLRQEWINPKSQGKKFGFYSEKNVKLLEIIKEGKYNEHICHRKHTLAEGCWMGQERRQRTRKEAVSRTQWVYGGLDLSSGSEDKYKSLR